MRNKYAGVCYRCGLRVEPGEGHFERFRSGWRTQHAQCAVDMRGTLDPAREADRLETLKARAGGTGKLAQDARRELRSRGLL